MVPGRYLPLIEFCGGQIPEVDGKKNEEEKQEKEKNQAKNRPYQVFKLTN
jgi:hypothetical protein